MIIEGAFILAYGKVYPEDIIRKIEMIVQPKAELKGLKFNIKIQNILPIKIITDSRRLIQVLLNICSNSIKYTFNGSIDISFRMKEKERLLKIDINDTGIGISKTDLEHIGKLFSLLDKKTMRDETGIGLGLMVSKGIIKAMGGNIEIYSKIGKGTLCEIEIPVDGNVPIEVPDEKENISQAFTLNHELSARSENNMYLTNRSIKRLPLVMIVDDEPLIQFALGTILTKLGCVVDKASNGRMSVEMVQKKLAEGDKYDLIFMDANMPIMSGYEAAQIISKDSHVETPIICVSAQDSVQHREKCNKCGMQEIISKPCSTAKLSEILKKYRLV